VVTGQAVGHSGTPPRPDVGGSAAERVPAPPRPPPPPEASADDERPAADERPAVARVRAASHVERSVAFMQRQRKMSMKYMPSISQGDVQRGALLHGIKRSGVNMLKQVVKAEGIPEHGVAREWPLNWRPHCRAAIKEHDQAVNSCRVFSRDRRVLSCSDDGTLRMADLATGTRIGRPLRGHDGAVNDCRVFADQKRALSCGEDGTLKIWRLMTAEEIETGWSDCHQQPVNAIDIFITDEGKECALSASADGTLKLWDLATGECTATLRGTDENDKHDNSTVESCCAYKAPSGEWEALSGGADNHVRRWGLTGASAGKEVKHADGSPWMAKQDTLKGRNGHTGVVRGCAVSSNGECALTCSGDRFAIFWDLNTGSVLRTMKHVASVFGCCLLPDDKTAITVSSSDPRLWDVHSGECLRVFAGHTGEVLHCVSQPGLH
jgi:WD40 repeat protein